MSKKSKKPPKKKAAAVTPPPPVKKAEGGDTQDLPHMDASGGGSLIHSHRGGSCSESSCDYQKNCAGDRRDARLDSSQTQIHHVLPVSAVNGYRANEYSGADVDKIATVYRRTKWCIHQKANVLALPVLAAFDDDDASSIADIDLPAHTLHHNIGDGYTQEVKKEIARTVWNKIRKNKRGQKPHFTPQKVINQFTRLGDRFLQDLKDRGKRPCLDDDGKQHGKGTEAALKQEGEVTYWYLPLSMASDEVAKRDDNLCFAL